MLYNPQWQAPDPFSLTSLIAWLRTKDPEERYEYGCPSRCMLGQWVRSMDINAHPLNAQHSFWYRINGQAVDLFKYVNIAHSPDFGTALQLAEATLKVQQKEKENVA